MYLPIIGNLKIEHFLMKFLMDTNIGIVNGINTS